MREQSWWLLCVSEAKQGSKQAQVPSVVECAGAFIYSKYARSGGSFGFSHAARSRGPARVCTVCTSLYGTSRFGGFPASPPPTLRVEDEHQRTKGRAPPTTDRSAVIQRAVAGSGFPFYRCSVPPGRSGGRPRRRAGGGSRTRSPQQSAITRSRLEAPHTQRTGPGIARIRVWPYTGYACISYRHLSSVHGRLSHDGPSHF